MKLASDKIADLEQAVRDAITERGNDPTIQSYKEALETAEKDKTSEAIQ